MFQGGMPAVIILAVLLLFQEAPGEPDQRSPTATNMWTTLARSLGQDHICLHAEAATDPLSSCLVGIPVPPRDFPSPLDLLTNSKDHDYTEAWRNSINLLPFSPEEPLKFNLLGSAKAPFCVRLSVPYSLIKTIRSNDPQWTLVEGESEHRWCEETLLARGPTTPDLKPRSLPQGFYFICGNRAWNGIPSHLLGGPCTIGHVTLFTPSTPKLANWPAKNSEAVIRQKKDLTEFGPDCDSKIYHWNEGKRVAISLFLPWVSAGKAIGELGKLECWSVKHANLTSTAIAGLLADEKITRQAMLQNRAAIDYLLLLHHHRCEEFEGLCCFNLTSKAPNVQKALEEMKGLVHDIKRETEDWLGNLLSGLGLSGWAGSILKDILFGLFIILLVILGCSIVWAVIRRLVQRLVTSSVNVVSFPDTEADPEDSETSSDHQDYTTSPEEPEDEHEV